MLIALLLAAAVSSPSGQDATAPASAQAVSVDAYHRNYEGAKTDSEQRFDSGIWSAYNARENQSGPMEGSWVVADSMGHQLIGLELRSDRSDGRLDGAWRSMQASYGINASGFVSDIEVTGRDMEVNYIAGSAHSPNIVRLHKDSDGQWRGSLMDVAGHKTPVMLSRVSVGN